MSGRLNGAYWKLWHDVQSRFVISLAFIALVFLGVFSQTGGIGRPDACISVNTDMSWGQMRAAIIKAKADVRALPKKLEPGDHRDRWLDPSLGWGYSIMPWGLPNYQQIEDGDVLNAHCKANERPLLAYAAMAEGYIWRIKESTYGPLTYIFLFIGILLSVGPPFSGESMEAFSLTFSLPWSREKWLVTRVAMAIMLLLLLALITVIALRVGTHMPFMSQMKGGYPKSSIENEWQGDFAAWWLVLAGLVGISLGTVASLFSRNVLTATVMASLAAYVLVTVRLPALRTYGSSGDILPIIVNGGTLTAVLVISIAALIASARLRTTDI